MMKIEDIMTKDVVSVKPDTPVDEIANLLVEHNIGGVPVVDEDRRVVGIVNESDLFLKEKGIPFSAIKVPMLFEQWVEPEKLLEIFAEAHLHTARDVMTEPVVCVEEQDTIPHVAFLMARHDIKHVPVVRDEALVGIVTRQDIIRFMALKGKDKK
jgi:CBS domain-containing protein